MEGRFGDAGEAMHALSRLLGQGGDELVREARAFFRVSGAMLLEVVELEGCVELLAAEPPGAPREELLPIVELPPVADVIDGARPVWVSGEAAAELAAVLAGRQEERSALLLPIRLGGEVRYLLVLTDERERDFSAEEVEVAEAFASAATAGLAQFELAAGHEAQTQRQAALARAARTLNDTLDLNQVLVKICEESASILGAEVAAVYTGNGSEGLRVEAALGLPAEAIGSRVDPGEGLAGQVALKHRSLATNDHSSLERPSTNEMYAQIRSALAVPMHWEGELRGVLATGFTRAQLVTPEQLGLLETFAEIAASACRNASAHAGLAVAARTDALTGCLNHAAMHDALGRELERSRRSGSRLCLAIVDLDDFKQVNELHGHLAGDEVLREVGAALLRTLRTYDTVARYGGDEFALVAVDADEGEASEVTERSLRALGRVAHARATAGVAESEPDESPTGLIERADRALRYAKHRGERGSAQRASLVPDDFEPTALPRAALRRP